MPYWQDFPEANIHLVAPEGHEESVEALHAHTDGVIVTTLHVFGPGELEYMIEQGNRSLWVQHLTGSTIPPVFMSIVKPEMK